MYIKRTDFKLYPDTRRVVARYFRMNAEKVNHILNQVLGMDTNTIEDELEKAQKLFGGRHRDLGRIVKENYARVEKEYGGHPVFKLELDQHTKDLLGMVFTNEYSIEAAALFNPSLVRSPDQSGLKEGQVRCVMSLRAAGEGHISSMEFRSIVIGDDETIHIEPVTGKAECGSIVEETDTFYESVFPEESRLDERVIFPQTRYETNGIEDARWVEFEEPGHSRYFATYTAYDGRQIYPVLIETDDFKGFRSTVLKGTGARNKNLALFPRKTNGRYYMLARIDGRSHYLMSSDDLYTWNDPQLLAEPKYPWEMVQVGNNGSPIETEQGWLVFTHGVGPMRRYALGAMLLDPEDPSMVIARSSTPILEPLESEREGYVPNVLYTCGGLKIDDKIYLPYAASDQYCTIAVVDTEALIRQLKIDN